jgi:hypothetical protein
MMVSSLRWKTPETGLEAGAGDSIFDSMFTTKADGMGMSLSISRSIIAAQ